jgi:hypothetical protein
MSSETPWNTCPHCEGSVDVDEVTDGSEVHCWGCDRWLVVVEYEGSSLGLEAIDNDDESEPNTPALTERPNEPA